jgi:hypothetical protein
MVCKIFERRTQMKRMVLPIWRFALMFDVVEDGWLAG